jgi:hypothetical protein
MKEDNNIEDLFRSSFDHFEVAPPPAVKEAIDRGIGGSSKKRIWWFSALVLLLGAASLLFFFTQSNGKQNDRSSTNQLASTEPGTKTSGTTANSNTNQSTHEKSTSFINQSNNKPTSSSQKDNASKQVTHSNGNQDGLSDGSGNDPLKSAKAKRGNNQPSSVKSTSKQSGKAKKTSGKSTKKSPKKRSGNDSGTPSFDDLAKLNLTDNALNNSGITNGSDNSSAEGSGKLDPTKGNENGAGGSTPPEKNDSIPGKPNEPIIIQAQDSTKTDGKDPKPKKEKGTERNWLASVYVGPSFGINSKSNDALKSVSEKTSFQFSAEINRSLFKGYGLSTGFGFNQRQETFKLTNLQILDSAIVVFDSIPIYQNPQQPDTIIGWTDTTYYFDDTLSTDFNQVNRIQTIGIPLYFTKHFSFSDQWGLLVNAGAVFQFNKYVTTQQASLMIPAPTVNNFSMNVTARIHATYTWKQWMFSAGVSTGWELKQALIYEGLDRKRYFITPQFGIHFRF